MAWVERRIRLLVAITLVAFGAGLTLEATHAFETADRRVGDVLMRWRDKPRVPTEIVTVALDHSVSRTEHARAINRLHQAGAKVIAYDVAFEGRRSRREDERLFRALRRARTIVLGVLAGGRTSAGYTLPRLFRRNVDLDAAGVRVGFAAYPREPDGKIRRVAVTPLELDGSGRLGPPTHVDPHNLPGFAYLVALVASGGQLNGGVPTDNREIIDFRGPPGTFRSIPFGDLVRARAPMGVFRDKIVIVGAARPFSLSDSAVPTGDAMDPVEIDANAVATLLDGAPLRQPTLSTTMLVLLAAAFCPLVIIRAGPWSWGKRWLLVPTTAIAIIGGAWPHFDDLIFWPWTYAATSLAGSALGICVVLIRSRQPILRTSAASPSSR
jgi:CHASE2 domain-containing sensor protein